LRCSVSKEPADEPPIFVTPITLHRLSAFASGDDDFFQEKAISNYPMQEIRFSGRVHFIPILKETP
jgi:hypothetical protein